MSAEHTSVLQIHAGAVLAGRLFQSGAQRNRFVFGYQESCPAQAAVSLTMPVVPEQYVAEYKLHPIFDMNLPEGALGERLRKQFAKVIPHFNDLALLQILGASQIGRLRFCVPGQDFANVPSHDLQQILTHDGAEGLFESLLEQCAVFSGISGAQPKVLVRDQQTPALDSISYRGATHIVKAWHEDEFPQLAANEYFCMRAAFHAGLAVPNFSLSANGKFLVVERFDLEHGRYLGFEDFCVLNGKTAAQKYDGSYENISKRIREFVSPEQVLPALEAFFKMLVLSCVVKNGDAHLKNFGVLYRDCESAVYLSPAYDIVSTTPYLANDMLALTLGGSKRWPQAKALLAFARVHCGISPARAQVLLREVRDGVWQAREELATYLRQTAAFEPVGALMLREWEKGLALSIQPG